MHVVAAEVDFHKDMIRIYERARDETDYAPPRFMRLVSEYGGVAAARRLLHSNPSDGFTALWSKGRLDLTAEALMLQPRYAALFSRAEQAVAERRLRDHGFDPRRVRAV